MHILVVNDDGIDAPGIYALAQRLHKEYKVTMVAPSMQRSATSHSITISKALTVKKHIIPGLDLKAYSVDGTPADCVRLALDNLVEDKVDFVVSGINRGFNLGMDVLYSGTVSAAVEAAIYKVPSMAVSTDQFDHIQQYKTAADYAAILLNMAIEHNLKNDVVLNLNVPPLSHDDVKGVKVCRMGNMVYGNYFVKREGNENSSQEETTIFDIKGNTFEPEAEDMDTFYIKEGYVTVTPLHYDLTNFKLLKEVSQWFY
ncbi:MAG: 5'/3'-nucleotidase SurE [Clostridiales bacterium]|uniref:5'/3'-nucleotidase SurE n=1 Tax=Clostridium sp. N3C TaxID=1776758 RepID=UPI00094339D4|nr:5'/3'-nucleotidase SurE [Clostridium sp. N3C]NLZ47406.1 5'/3'-nucleotidase SurE [Clostridiales bacterium]